MCVCVCGGGGGSEVRILARPHNFRRLGLTMKSLLRSFSSSLIQEEQLSVSGDSMCRSTV